MLIKFNRPTVLGFKSHLLKPGINDIPAEDVAEMQDDSILQAKFDSGELEILDVPSVKASVKGVAPSAIDRFLAAPAKDAVKFASQTVDSALLDGWLGCENRKAVRAAIRAQIAKIGNVKFRDDKQKMQLETAGG